MAKEFDEEKLDSAAESDEKSAENERIEGFGDKSLFAAAKEKRAAQKREYFERLSQKQLNETKKEEQRRSEYEKKLRDEKIELLRKKQLGENTEEAAPEQEKKYSFIERVRNFFFSNGWWLGIVFVFCLIFIPLLIESLTKEKPDLTIVYTCDDDILFSYSDKITGLFAQYCEDYNNDGKVLVDMHYIPLSESQIQNDYFTGVLTKLQNEIDVGDGIIFLSCSDADEYLYPEDSLISLKEMFPDDENVSGCKYYLNDTSFAELIGYDTETYPLPENMYIGLRNIRNSTESSIMRLSEAYAKSEKAFKGVISQMNEASDN